MALIQEITAAFDGVSREDGVTLHEAKVIDYYGSLEERAVARTQDTEDKWQDVPEEDIRFTNAVLSFLDPKGFHYYIPSYVVWYLRNIDNETPDYLSNSDSIIFHLAAGFHGEVDDFYLSKFKLFTSEQAKAIAHFLIFEAEREDAVKIEWQQWRQESMSNEGFSQEEQEEINAAWQEKFRRERDMSDNDARLALERYWGQFL